jgi:hypothetical protein
MTVLGCLTWKLGQTRNQERRCRLTRSAVQKEGLTLEDLQQRKFTFLLSEHAVVPGSAPPYSKYALAVSAMTGRLTEYWSLCPPLNTV